MELREIVAFKSLSVVNIQTKSVTAGQTFANWSITSNFAPTRSLNPAETSAAVIANRLATLLMDLYKPQ